MKQKEQKNTGTQTRILEGSEESKREQDRYSVQGASNLPAQWIFPHTSRACR